MIILPESFRHFPVKNILDLLISCLDHLSPDLVHPPCDRVDEAEFLLIAPLWSSAKRSVLNEPASPDESPGRLGRVDFIRRICMIENTSTLYKMIILYMLKKVTFPLSNSQITNFLLDHEYTTYFHIQQTIHRSDGSRI